MAPFLWMMTPYFPLALALSLAVQVVLEAGMRASEELEQERE